MQRLIFDARTVPGLVIDRRERISGSRRIMRRLDALAPDPPLYPPGRPEVEEAERWGDEEFQQVARDLIWAGAAHLPDALVGYSKGARIALPAPVVRALAPGIVRAQRALNRTGDGKAARRLQELPAQVAKIDGWIADGTIGDAEHPNAADLQILSTVRLLMTLGDLREMIAARPSGRLAAQVFPQADGDMPAGSLAAA
jgi:glutathione S-transferase